MEALRRYRDPCVEAGSAETRMQIWDKEQTPETAATKQEEIHQDFTGLEIAK
jgi:hypothetical protein